MSTRKKSKAMKEIENALGEPLTFRSLLRSLRETDEISQVELASRVGISKSKLCDIEKGRRGVSISLAAEFAKALGYPVPVFVSKVIEEQIESANLKIKVKVEAA